MEPSENLKRKAIVAVVWQTAQKGIGVLLGFVISVILARLLTPEDYGLVALVSIFLALAGLMTDSGLGTALVQKKDIDEIDLNTVFLAGLALAAIVYLLLFFLAPAISNIYQEPDLILIVRIMGIGLFFSSVSSVQNAIVSRQLKFKNFFWVSLVQTLVSGSVGIWMAYRGFGVWAIIAQSLVGAVTGVVVMNRIVKWLPKFEFSIHRLKGLFKFGLNYVGANLVGTFFNELRNFLIGIKYKPEDLAYNNRGGSIPTIVNNTLSGTISSVLFPVLSKLQEDKVAVKNAMRRSMSLCSFLLSPIMLLLAATANNIILVLYTSKWIEAVPYMQVLCLGFFFGTIGSANIQAMNAMGRSDIVFKLEFIKKPIFLGILLYTMQISPLAMVWGNVVYGVFAASINAIPNKKLIDYSYLEQLRDVLPSLILGILVSGVALLLEHISMPPLLLLAVQYIVCIGLYIFVSKCFRLEGFTYFVDTLKGFLAGR